MTKPFYRYLTTPVSREISVAVVANGTIRAKHVRRLMRMLALDLEFLQDDERRPPMVPVPFEEMPA